MRSAVLVGPLAVAACCCLCGGAAAYQSASLPSPPRPHAAAAAAAPAVDAAATLHPLVRRRAPLPLAVFEPPPPPTLLGPISTRVRRFVYQAIEPLDRGDFRWEFLVPWLEEDARMTGPEKAVVAVSFVTLAFALQLQFDPLGSVTDHLSYIAFFFSYAIGNPIAFRIIAMVASVFEIISGAVEQEWAQTSLVPVGYNVLFLFINGYYVLRWQLSQTTVQFPPTEEQLFVSCFEPLGVNRRQFRVLLRDASWHEAAGEPEVLFVQGEPLRELFVSLEGEIDIVRDGVAVASIPPYQVIGEAALLENLRTDGQTVAPARATVVAEEGAKFVSFPQEVFYKQMQEDREFAATLGFAIARTLSRKLGQAREDQQASGVALSLAREADRTAAERRRDAGDVAADGGDGGWDGSAAQSADLSEYDVGMW